MWLEICIYLQIHTYNRAFVHSSFVHIIKKYISSQLIIHSQNMLCTDSLSSGGYTVDQRANECDKHENGHEYGAFLVYKD